MNKLDVINGCPCPTCKHWDKPIKACKCKLYDKWVKSLDLVKMPEYSARLDTIIGIVGGLGLALVLVVLFLV